MSYPLVANFLQWYNFLPKIIKLANICQSYGKNYDKVKWARNVPENMQIKVFFKVKVPFLLACRLILEVQTDSGRVLPC